MEHMHSLLKRQIRRCFGDQFDVPKEWKEFIDAVNDAYHESDADRTMIERSLELSSQELIQTNSEMRTVFQAIPDLLFRLDNEGRILDYKAGAAVEFFLKPKELIGKRIQNVPSKHVSQKFDNAIRQVLDLKTMVSIEYPLSIQSREHFYEARLLPLQENQIIVVIRDITEHKLAEEALRYERNLLRTLIDNLPDAVYVKDTECRKTVANSADVRFMGQQLEADVLGKTDFDFYPAKDSAEYYADDQSVIKTGRPVLNKEEFMIDKEGKGHWVSTSKLPLRDAQGRIIGLVGVGREISERKDAEIALRESEQKFRALVEGSAAAIWIHDTSRFHYANPAGLAMAGYTAEELYQLAPIDIVHRDFRVSVMKQSKERMEGKEVPKHYEYQILKKTGEAIWIDFSGALINYDGKPAIIASAYDITERKNLEEQLLQSQKMEGIGRLAGGVAHDYNNILGIIIGYSELITDKMKKTSPVYNYVEMIASAAKRGSEITRQLLAFARRETVSPRVLNPNEAILSLQQILQRLIGENLKLIVHPQKDIWNVKIDRTQLDQILVNLATNARDAIDDVGTITIETSNVSIDQAYTQNRLDFASGEYVMISFTDTGEGMSKETMEKIFEPFFTTKSKGQGTGLGLSTVYGIVKQNGGSINVYSEPIGGTTFKIYLRRHYGETEKPEPAHAEESIFGSETVLVVEDQPDFLELARNCLKKYGYKVLTALGPEEGIIICENYEKEVHLLLTDVIMPAMNGKELRDRIRILKPNIKTIFMSGYTANVIAHRGVLDEGVDFIQKPFSPYALALKVHAVLKA
jgi:PAS domain S-box-containing protein